MYKRNREATNRQLDINPDFFALTPSYPPDENRVSQGLKLGFNAVMDYIEIAKILGISRQSVQRHEASALFKARKVFEKRGLSFEDFFPSLRS